MTTTSLLAKYPPELSSSSEKENDVLFRFEVAREETRRESEAEDLTAEEEEEEGAAVEEKSRDLRVESQPLPLFLPGDDSVWSKKKSA